MKRIILLFLALFLSISPSLAQKNRSDRRDSIKATRVLEDKLRHEQAIDALNKKAFVLKVDRRIYEKRSKTWGCDPNTNFVLLNGNEAIVQINDPKPQNCDTFKGNASDFKTVTNKKGETTFEMKLKKGSFIIFVKITLNKNDNYCYARLSGRTYYPRLTITGRLYPLEDVGVFIGIDNR